MSFIKLNSFNFLPQLIHDKIRLGIEIDKELILFKERMKRLSELDDEKQAKKHSRLIQVASTAVVIASVPWNDLYDFSVKVHISPLLAFLVCLGILIVVGMCILVYQKLREEE